MDAGKGYTVWLILSLLVLGTAACGGSAAPETSPSDAAADVVVQTEVADVAAAEPEAIEVGEEVLPTEESAQPDEPEEASEPAVTLPEGFPTEPAGIEDDFREDPQTFVAATGRPQVIEFFTHW